MQLTRDQQIKLLCNAEERHLARMRDWMANVTIRSAVCASAPGRQDSEGYMTVALETNSKLYLI